MKPETIRDFQAAKFGMFLHWGLYAVPGGRWNGESMDYIGEWIQSKFRIPNAEYARLAREFNPDRFDAEEWVAKAAAAGVKYLVYTAKHHDGFAMYRSRASAFNIADATPFGRDPLAELTEACRKHDVRLGIYYSHCLDWSDPDGGDPGPEFPRNLGGMSWGNDWDFPDWKAKRFEAYFRRKAIPQVTELLTGYGPVAVIWFDCPVAIEPRFSRELRDLVHRIQPECLINSRIGHGCGDYMSLGDNLIPGGGTSAPTEAPMTLNDTWGFKYDDRNWKSPEAVIELLIGLAEKNTNCLLNIGPRPDGAFPEEADRVLAAVAGWRRENGDGIAGSSGTPFPQSLDFACCTVEGNRLHLFLKKPVREATLRGVLSPVVRADVPFRQNGDAVTLEIPDFSGRFLPRITLEFAALPEIAPWLCPQDGVLTLIPGGATLVHGGGASAARNTAVSVAGEVLDGNARCRIGEDGTLEDWHSSGDRVEWTLFFPESGTYRIAAVTRNRLHSAPWIGEREVELDWRGRRLAGELRPDRPLPDACYAAAETELGELTVSNGESGKLSLRTTALKRPEAAWMNFVALRLCRK